MSATSSPREKPSIDLDRERQQISFAGQADDPFPHFTGPKNQQGGNITKAVSDSR
jgi:hypothetical protein